VYERINQSDLISKDEEQESHEKKPETEDVSMEEEANEKKKPKLQDSEHPINQKIMLENQKYWQNKFLFGSEYFDFIAEVTHYWDTANIIPSTVINRNNDTHLTQFGFRTADEKKHMQAELSPPSDEVFDLRL